MVFWFFFFFFFIFSWRLLVCSFCFVYLYLLGILYDLVSGVCLGSFLTWWAPVAVPADRELIIFREWLAPCRLAGAGPLGLPSLRPQESSIWVARDHFLCPLGFPSGDLMTPFLSLVYLGTGRRNRMDRFSRLLRMGLATLPGACSRCCAEGGAPYSPAETLQHLD